MKEKLSKKCSNCGKTIPNSKYTICLGCSKSRLKVYHNFKIQNLEDTVSFDIDPSLMDIFKKIEKRENDEIIPYLKELLIIKLVSSVEIHFRDLMRYWYSAFNHNLTKLFPEDRDLEKKINEIRKISNSTLLDKQNPKVLKPTKNPDWNVEADIIATSFNFQNLDNIGHTFSNLVGLDFLQAIKDFEEITSSGNLKNCWDKIEELFELRHQVVHAGKKVELTFNELTCEMSLILTLISESSMFFDYYMIYDTDSDNEDDEFFNELGISKENINQIIQKNKKT